MPVIISLRQSGSPPPQTLTCVQLLAASVGAKRNKKYTHIVSLVHRNTDTMHFSVIHSLSPFLPSMKLISEGLYGSYSSLPFLSIAQIAKGARHFPCSTIL
jgi:hypothetical protein